MIKAIAVAAAFAGIALAAAGTASADLYEPPPPPSNTDLTSGGTTGNEQMGTSRGSVRPGRGFAVWSGDRRFESVGWPVHYSSMDTADSTRLVITDYAYEGGIEHWVFYDSPNLSVHRWNEFTPAEGFNREAEIRVGSMQYSCDNDGCEMVE